MPGGPLEPGGAPQVLLEYFYFLDSRILQAQRFSHVTQPRP